MKLAKKSPGVSANPQSDSGMTLIELLVSIVLLGIVTTVIAAAITVTIRQTSSTEGRVNLASAEQSIDTWIPADLISTDVTANFEERYGPAFAGILPVDTLANASPCGNCGGIDMSGSNALQLAWFTASDSGAPILTQVQYQYIEVGGRWQLQRIECVGSNACSKSVVLRDLAEPPVGYDPNTDRPTWILTTPTLDPDIELSQNAQRIVVTIHGGGSGDGSGGGSNSINLTAGGVETSDIDADDFTVPAFVRARSRCGGPVTLLLDNSSSIMGGDKAAVRAGARAFVEAFRGTPVSLQVVRFSDRASVFAPPGNTDWNYFWDMTNDADVDALIGRVTSGSGSNMNFGTPATNWEDAWFRVAYDSAGATNVAAPSNRVVFFTDGVPTRNRRAENSGTWYSDTKGVDFPIARYSQPPWPDEPNSATFHQESFDRAFAIVTDVSLYADIIAVGVGNAFTGQIGNGFGTDGEWIRNAPASGPATAENPAPTGEEVLSRLIANLTDDAARATLSGGVYTNPDVAELYKLNDFGAFAAAMKAAALKDCGGTLTVQTRLGSTTGPNVDDEFVYENSEYRDDGGAVVSTESRLVTTSTTFRTGTFDFDIPPSTSYFSADIVPQELQTLDGYTYAGWNCRAGATPKTIGLIDIDGSSYKGFTVDVKANEAVSCILTVTSP